MAHSLSAKQRIRQNAKRRARHRARKNQIRLAVRSFDETLRSGDAGKSADTLKVAVKKIDQVAAKGTIHKNTASRKKSQLHKRLNAVATSG